MAGDRRGRHWAQRRESVPPQEPREDQRGKHWARKRAENPVLVEMDGSGKYMTIDEAAKLVGQPVQALSVALKSKGRALCTVPDPRSYGVKEVSITQ